jgi:hypothetical protein
VIISFTPLLVGWLYALVGLFLISQDPTSFHLFSYIKSEMREERKKRNKREKSRLQAQKPRFTVILEQKNLAFKLKNPFEVFFFRSFLFFLKIV